MDRRSLRATGRVAHVSLRGQVERPAYVEGEALLVQAPLADLLRGPGGARERQLWLGQRFVVLDREEGHAFGFAEADGYCGWLRLDHLAEGPSPTHWVASPSTILLTEPRTASAEVGVLPMGAGLAVVGQVGKFAETTQGFVPARHLATLGDWRDDPVAVAASFEGTPYLWGGNSRAGVDCSGLVQGAYRACGISLPGDSDLQMGAGQAIEAGEARRGDLVFWKGHVAILTGADQILHANGAAMSVAYEGLEAAVARIRAAGEGEVLGWRRVWTPLGV